MVREARFAWDSDNHQPQELSRSAWDCEDPELDEEVLKDVPHPKKKSRRRSSPKSRNTSTNDE